MIIPIVDFLFGFILAVKAIHNGKMTAINRGIETKAPKTNAPIK